MSQEPVAPKNEHLSTYKDVESSAADTRVDGPIAYNMAHAGKSEIEAARESMRVGRFSEVAGHLALAEAAWEEAHRTHEQAGQASVIAQQQFRNDFMPTADAEVDPTLERQVTEAKQALAEKYVCSVEDFELVTYEDTTGAVRHVVAYVAPMGIDLGKPEQFDRTRSWKKIMSEKNKQHFVTIDGVEYDTRKGMTERLYAQMVLDMKRKGRELPDNPATHVNNWNREVSYKYIPSYTLLTGDTVSVGDVSRARVTEKGNVYYDFVHPSQTDVYDNLFRPAIVLSNELR